MKPPPFLMGAGLLFWGWQAGFPFIGALMAIAIESPRWIQVRWELSDEDFRRIWVFSTLLLLGAAVYAFSLNDGPGNFRVLFQNPSLRSERNAGTTTARTMALTMRWLPMIFFVFIGAQIFSVREKVPLHTISTLVRRRWKKARRLGQPWPDRSVNICFPYFALCLLGAAAHASEDTWFFWGLCVLLAWTLWAGRPWRYGLAIWACAVGIAIVLGYFGQASLGRVQRYFETFNPNWLNALSRKGTDPFQSKTALGQIGRMKLSSKIMLRLQAVGTNPVPTLVREASYRNYKAQIWYAGNSRNDFENILEDTNRGTWFLLRQKTNATFAVNLACYLPGGKALLPLPAGSGRLEHLSAYLLSKNSAGAVLAQGPGLVMFDAYFGPGLTIDSPPDPRDDLYVNPREADALNRAIAEVGVTGQNAQQAMRALNAFFQSKFTYRMWQDQPLASSTNDTPLSRFLFETHSGHCEYFATATVLLLRQLGIPTRYAVGYAIHEPSGHGYIARERDAHAWCLVWDKESGLWRDFDTTPASWVEAESSRTSPFQAISDLWSRLRFELAKLRWGQTRLRQYILWGLIPVLGLLFYQIIRRIRGKRGRNGRGLPADNFIRPGLDSEFYQLERKLSKRGATRQPGEPLSVWLSRAVAEPELLKIRQPLQQVLFLHYRYRFDPAGLSQFDREALRREASSCLAHLKGTTNAT
jgi:hypothetical protein